MPTEYQLLLRERATKPYENCCERKLVTLMSACSGRNYNFLCINVVFGVFLHESARTAAKSRTNLSTNSGKARKRLGRLTPNLAHICKFIWEWIYAKQIAPRDTRGHLEGFRGSGKGHRLNTSRPSTPQEALGGGGLGCHKCKSLHWEAVKRLYRMAKKLAHNCRCIWEWIYAKQIAPRALGGFRGQTFKSLGKLSNGWTDWHQLWFTSAYSSGNVHRLNPSRPSIPQEAVRGGGRGSQIQKSWEAVKRLHRLAPQLVHVGGFVWEWT